MGKYISTIIITLIFSALFILYGRALLLPMLGENINKTLILIIALPFIILVGALIYNMQERIKELKEENKDDISKY